MTAEMEGLGLSRSDGGRDGASSHGSEHGGPETPEKRPARHARCKPASQGFGCAVESGFRPQRGS